MIIQKLFLAAIAMFALSTPLMASTLSVNVPDGGVTAGMLAVALGGLVLLRRKL